MIYLMLLSALAGALCVLLLQILLLYRNKPEPVPRHVQYVKPVVEPSLKDYLSSGKEPPAESCHFLNAIFLFLFRELRDTPIVRHWLTKKIKVEFEELLQTKTAGRLLEGLSLRDISLGNALPVFKSARLLQPVVGPNPGPGPGPGSGSGSLEEEAAGGAAAAAAGGIPEELNFELELEYNGGFHLAIDVDLVFGKSAYLFVKMRRVVGRLRLQFTRRPFTHWSFAFMDEPFIDFEVKSQFEGRPMPQLTTIIVNQLKRVIKRKHTLPNYKIRYKPFFPYQVQTVDAANCDLYMQDVNIVEGRLKVTVVECSRLFILGSYDRTEHIHCTLELSTKIWKEKPRSSIKTVELIKGNSQSVGLTFRQIQGSDGDAVHVSVETVTPNSSAAAADLQKGDRLIAIGGVKVTSSVHVLKLIKQAGDKVMVYYERPVGGHQNQQCSSLQDNFGQLEDTGFGSQFGPQTFDDEGVLDSTDAKDLDSEFEELVCPEIKPPPIIIKEDFAPSNQSPKRSVVTLAAKPLGTISPILNRKLNLGNYQIPLKPQQKDVVKSVQSKCPDTPDAQQPSKPVSGSTNKPPVPPRPQIKLTVASSETQYQLESGDVATEKLDKPIPSTNSAERNVEKSIGKIGDQNEDPSLPKSSINKQDCKEKVPEATSNMREGAEDNQIWESSEVVYRKRFGKWNKATCVFEIESHHKYVNVAIWCKEPFKPGGLICLGHASIKLEEIAMECLSTASLEYQATFRLSAPEPKAAVSRTALRNLSTHKGFNEKLCYGDITLNFTYLKEGDTENSSVQVEKEKEDILQEDIPTFSKEDLSKLCTEKRHNFQDTQFQNPTWCDYCKKKVWTKAASQCMICAFVCHKKCQDKCLATEPPFSVAPERRVDLESKSSFNRSTGLTRHIINTSSRLLNLRPGPRARLADPGVDLVEPSPKHTPNTSDNESSDTETYSASSPSKRQAASTGTKLPVKKEGGLDDSVFIAVKEIGRDLYRGLPTDERCQKLELMLDKLQNEIDQELEHNYALIKEQKESTDPRKKLLLSAALSKSGERLQALTLLTIHYKAGYEDLELSETVSSEQQTRKVTKLSDDILSITADEIDIASQTDVQSFSDVSNEQIIDDAESLS
ncbi:PDZ domain-containing protein 8 [Stegostoma tigrinum]|uniref:PDZ domain-containing protein 8 n=1 Tax=Stegostoma tigrinum TaxID=3053191 RepID=UPI00202AC6BE|nr:PDZ domain-containing protein 8 [Stegostoma tigrinum]